MNPLPQRAVHTSRQFNDLPEPLRSVLRIALTERATDIHFDPAPSEEVLRFRVDGILQRKELIQADQRGRIINQIKVAANLNTDHSFVPLESDIELQSEWGDFRIRVSIIPVGVRAAAHLRFLAADRTVLDLESLGLRAENLQHITDAIHRGHGLILVAGGTGTGKTSTLYALANALDLQRNIVVSIEDPVEFRLPGIRQLQVNQHHGLDMQAGLRVLLRMDPDAILIGEIRDENSATTAARAALAGRLVVATIHATDAAMAIDALKHYSVPRYVLSGALRLVITQELLRRVCRKCSQQRAPTPNECALYEKHGLTPPVTVSKAVGCGECDNYGYAGRIGIYEITPIGAELSEAISRGDNRLDFCKRIAAEGHQSLEANALQKAACGTISIAEAKKLCFSR
ncbi:MAG: ATPase, T2SS/T4P/T4SS family [Kiritimatiellae bacterium]|nr:ATPase, T2SS/T4P/T4SS family [Kiritimatiellia bacterium]